MTTMDVVRPRLKWFVGVMDRNLARSRNQRKKDWRDPEACSVNDLFLHARSELNELDAELYRGGFLTMPPTAGHRFGRERAIRECADLANMAMMIGDRLRHEGQRRRRR